MGLFKQARGYFWAPEKPWSAVRAWAVPRLFQAWHSSLCCTLNITTSGFSRGMPLAFDHEHGALIVSWHDQTLIPQHLLRDLGLAGLFSTSRSGQMQSAFWELYGWRVVRGSSKKRDAVAALREALRMLRKGQSFAFTPDGPKGPRHKAQGGVVYLASNAPAVILPIGVAAARCWKMPSWDKYLIPKPFSRVHLHMGAPIHLPPDIPRNETSHYLKLVEDAINAAEREAEKQCKIKN